LVEKFALYGYTCRSTPTHCSDYEPTSLYCYYLMMYVTIVDITCLSTKIVDITCLSTKIVDITCLSTKIVDITCLSTKIVDITCLSTKIVDITCLSTKIVDITCLSTKVLTINLCSKIVDTTCLSTKVLTINLCSKILIYGTIPSFIGEIQCFNKEGWNWWCDGLWHLSESWENFLSVMQRNLGKLTVWLNIIETWILISTTIKLNKLTICHWDTIILWCSDTCQNKTMNKMESCKTEI
jgi:hypothetical protein